MIIPGSARGLACGRGERSSPTGSNTRIAETAREAACAPRLTIAVRSPSPRHPADGSPSLRSSLWPSPKPCAPPLDCRWQAPSGQIPDSNRPSARASLHVRRWRGLPLNHAQAVELRSLLLRLRKVVISWQFNCIFLVTSLYFAPRWFPLMFSVMSDLYNKKLIKVSAALEVLPQGVNHGRK
jgi:hypothetical protein